MTDLTDRELKAANTMNRAVVEKLKRKPAPTIRERWIAGGALRDLTKTVRSFPVESYSLPRHFPKILPRSELAILEHLVEQTRAINEECVGLRLGEAQILLAEDEDVQRIREGFCAAYDRIVPYRLGRPNARDRGDPVLKFRRIYHELVPGLDQILNLGPTVHNTMLLAAQDYAPWLLYQATWAPLIDIHWGAHEINVSFRVDRRHQAECTKYLQLYGWTQADDLSRVLALVDPAPEMDVSTEVAAQRLRSMAADFRAMQPMLIRNYRSTKTAIQLGPRLWACWGWFVGDSVGQVFAGPDERSLIAGEHQSIYRHVLRVGPDGLLAAPATPWLRTTDLPDLPSAMATNLVVVTRLMDQVLEMYSAVDVTAILANFKELAAADGREEEVEEESDAALAALAATAPDDEPTGTTSPDLSRRVRGIRFSRLKRALTSLGCEVRQGKGSEVVFYRAGYKNARLGHHKRNPEVSPVSIRMALKRLGLSVSELIEAY